MKSARTNGGLKDIEEAIIAEHAGDQIPPPGGENKKGKRRPTPGAGRPEPPTILTYAELKKIEAPVKQMLFEDYPLPANGAALICGQPRGGKTILAIQQALAVARNKPLYDYYRPRRTGAVMVVQQDDASGAASVRDLVEASGGGRDDMPFLTVKQKLPFGLGLAMLEFLEAQITEQKLVMVVLDSYTALRGARKGGTDIVKVEQTELSQLDELGKRLGCLIVIIHHDSTGKASKGIEWTQSAAGSYAMSASTEAQIHVARFADLDIKAPERLVRIRGRHTADMHLVLRFRSETEDYEHVMENSAATLYPLMRQIQTDFGYEAFTMKSFCKETGIARSTAYRYLDRLRQAEALQKLKNRDDYKLVVKL
jgi:hypothetical protein